MQSLVVYPVDEGQSKAIEVILKGMRIAYSPMKDEDVEELEDAELLEAMKAVEHEAPISQSEQKDFMQWLNNQT